MTAVEWLKSNLETFGDPEVCTIRWEDLDSLMLQAKQMEKEQIIDSYKKGEIQGVRSTNNFYYSSLMSAEEYYNDNYGKE